MHILLLNGPNLGMLGRREPDIYGTTTLAEIVTACQVRASASAATLVDLQSNHEGALIDRLEQRDFDAVIINPGALTHTSYALHDALRSCACPIVEVHISDISSREPWRQHSITAAAASHQITGKGWQGYLEALDWLMASEQK